MYTIRNKAYNKIVSNFETGEIRNQFGRNVADYVTYTNSHFGQTFDHPDVRARGCTRIEVLVY